MTPAQLSSTLIHIANKIDNSKEPSKKLVVDELRNVLAALEGQQRRADWEAVKKAWPDLSKKFVKLQYMIRNKDEDAANLAGAIGGILQDISESID